MEDCSRDKEQPENSLFKARNNSICKHPECAMQDVPRNYRFGTQLSLGPHGHGYRTRALPVHQQHLITTLRCDDLACF